MVKFISCVVIFQIALFAKTITEVSEDFALIGEPERALDGVVEAFEALGEGAEGGGFVAVLDMAVIHHGDLHRGVVGIDQLGSVWYAALAKAEGAAAGGFLDFGGGLFVDNFVTFRLDFFETVGGAGDFGDAFEEAIGVFGCHCVEFLDASLAVEVVDGAEVGGEFVYEVVEFLIGEGFFHFIDGVSAEGIRDGFAPVELPQAVLQVGGIANLDVLREGGIGEDVNAAGVFHNAYF